MNRTILGLLLVTALVATFAALAPTPAMAADPHSPTNPTGQPDQSCQDVFPFGPLFPIGFNTGGFNQAGQVYAGSGQNTQTPANPNAVSQYDVACFQQSP